MDYFDILLAKKLNGGGGDITIEDLYVNANGEYRAPSGKAYGKVTANVPAPSNALFKQTLSNLPSPIATFTGADAPIDSLKASIVGVQSGSGDPSPSNVRPITGWTSCEVTRTGKNLCDKKDATSLSGGILNLTGNGTFGFVKANNTYTFSFDVLESNSNNVQLRLNNGSGSLRNWTSGGLVANTRIKYTFTAIEDGLLNFWANSGAFTPNTKVFDNIQLEVGDVATTYEPYNGNTYTILFKDSSDNPITVYDGGIDITGGKLTNNSGIAVATDFIYGGTSSGGLKYFDYYPPNYTRILDKIRCSHLSYVAPSESWEMTTPCFTVNASRLRVYFADSVPNDLTMEYPFATPITMQFDPIALRSNGVTNISVNCGEVTECKYYSETP